MPVHPVCVWDSPPPAATLGVTTPLFPLQDATSSSPAQPEVIVVPLYLVTTDRGHEGEAEGTPGCVHTAPATTSAASPLTFPTLDDFIPPHLQRRPHQGSPASACGSLSPVSHAPPPSFSPPPPLVPPAPEDLRSVSEPDLTGAVPSTVSLLDPLPRLPWCLCPPAGNRTPLIALPSACVMTEPKCMPPVCPLPPTAAPEPSKHLFCPENTFPLQPSLWPGRCSHVQCGGKWGKQAGKPPAGSSPLDGEQGEETLQVVSQQTLVLHPKLTRTGILKKKKIFKQRILYKG